MAFELPPLPYGYNALEPYIDETTMKIHHDFDLSKVLWYKIGGKAKYFLEVSNKQDLLQKSS